MNPAYVAAGVRMEETAEKLRVLCAQIAEQFGEKLKRKHDHEFTGVFRCGECGNRMHSAVLRGGETLICDRGIEHAAFYVRVDERIREPWAGYLRKIQDGKFIEEWSAGENGDSDEFRRGLQRQVARFDQQASELSRRRDRAFDLLADGEPALDAQARTMLRKVDAEERALQLQQAAVAGQLASLPAPHSRDVALLRKTLCELQHFYETDDVRRRNRYNRALCAVFDSNPVLTRTGHRKIAVSWPVLDAVTEPEHSIQRT